MGDYIIMFGHQNNDTNDNNGNFSQDNGVQHGSDAPTDSVMDGLEPETVEPTTSSAPVVDDSSISSYVIPGVSDTGHSLSTALTPASAMPVSTSLPAPGSPPVIPHPSDPSGAPQATPPVTTASSDAKVPTTPSEASDLLTLKQSALHELSPLLGHLDQTPEEKFRTTMMMIQASDDHTMLQAAYDAAKSIHDEKARAQALLDVVNEINYFTQASAEVASS